MRQLLNDNKVLLILIGVVGLLVLGAIYYYFIYPKVETEKQMVQAIEQLHTEITTLEQHVAVLSVVDSGNVDEFELRKKLPNQRELDELLRTIHEVEVMSDSKIMSINFNNYDEEVAQADSLKSEGETTPEIDQTMADATEEAVDEVNPITSIDIESLPKELKWMSMELVMQVLDEAHLMDFLKELESIERIVRIGRVEFNSPGEEELTKLTPDKRIAVTVQLTTFYAEDVNN
ncbi:hypothetical protein [Sporosarcina sp. NPDC096371]|uniref:hypothetical protein n=1 Tax=Sporosarcina sp. NPDC096371 TaxID=3364530 RepID=UPI00381FE233